MELQKTLQESLRSPVAGGGLIITRWAIFAALLLAGFTAGVFAYASISVGTTMNNGPTGAWVFTAIRSSVLTLASLASFLGAAAWLRYFYVRDLQAQEDLQRFSNDMARASWIMEAALEIRKEHNEEVPPEWITGVTEGLFARGPGRNTVEEGAQALAALLGLSASANFGPGGVAVELNKKGRRVIAEAAQESGSS